MGQEPTETIEGGPEANQDGLEAFSPDEPGRVGGFVSPTGDHLTPEAIEKRFKSVGRSFDTYVRAVERELDFALPALKECPLCFMGVRGYVDLNEAGKQPEPLKNLILDFIGIATEKLESTAW